MDEVHPEDCCHRPMTRFHMAPLFNPRSYQKIVWHTKARVVELKARLGFTHIAYTGMSGALVAAPVCEALGIPMLLVRKDMDKEHGSLLVEGAPFTSSIRPNPEKLKYLIIDDLIDSGRTIRNVRIKLKDHECVGVLTFMFHDSHANEEERRLAKEGVQFFQTKMGGDLYNPENGVIPMPRPEPSCPGPDPEEEAEEEEDAQESLWEKVREEFKKAIAEEKAAAACLIQMNCGQ